MRSPDYVRDAAGHLVDVKAPSVRRRSLLTAGAGAAAAALAGCSDDESKAGGNVETVTYLTGFNVTGQDAPMYVAVDKGWFRQAGLEVKIEPGSGTLANLTKLVAGVAQFACIDVAGGIIEAGRGSKPKFKVFTAIYQRTVSCFDALPQANIRVPQDLVGKRIGYTFGGVNFSLLPAYARQAGVDYNALKLVLLSPQTIRPAFLAGEVDAIVEIMIGRPAVEAAARAAGKIGQGQSLTVLPYSEVLRDVLSNGIGCTDTMAATNPGLVRRFRDAALRGLEWTINNPREAGEIMARHVPIYKAPIAEAEIREMTPYVRTAGRPIGRLDKPEVARCIALLQGIGLVNNGNPDDYVSPDRVVDFNLVPAPAR